MKFLFLGAGAIGTYIAGTLAAGGEDVAIIEQPAVAARIGEQGLIVHRERGTITERRVSLFTTPADALGAARHDVCIFALKSFDTESAIDGLAGAGLEVPPILSLQNGVDNEPTIAARIGADRVIAGTLTTSIAKRGPGEVVEETDRGLGVAAGHPLSEALVATLNRVGLRTRAYPQAGPMKWSKLLTNLPGNATSAILDLPVADLFADRRLYEVELAVLRECLAVMAALGFAPVDLPRTPVRALALATRAPRVVAQPLLRRALGSSRGDKMPSFHIDLHGGRGRSEVGWLNGAVVRYGRTHGVPTPVNRVLTDTLEALTAGEQSLETYRKTPDALLRLLP